MVSYTGGPSPKRRRVDAPPTDEDVANTNRTLHAFTGVRQNKWMQIWADGRLEEGANAAPACRDQNAFQGIRKNRAGPIELAQQANRTASMDNASLPSVTLGQTVASYGNVIDLVDYESPYAIDFSVNGPNTDKRPEPVSRAISQPGSLPSPAPSIEPVQSPMATNTPEHTIYRTSVSGPSVGAASRYSSDVTNLTSTTPVQNRVVRMPAASGSGSASGLVRPGSHAHIQPSPASATPVLRSNATPRITSQSPLQPAQSFQGPAQQTAPRPNYYVPQYMFSHMQGFFTSHQSRQNGYDDGRKMLLREAVQANDIFYLVLSQLFCLRSIRPEHLPKLMADVTTASWETLERLLCSNNEIDRGLVAFFAQYPAPMHLMLASDSYPAFIQNLDAVHKFLVSLPQTWPGISEESRRLQAPPLAQDMVEKMQLKSPVLQMTAFRAIARGFWVESHNRGLEILDNLHKIDQETYFFRYWRRTEVEKRIARDVYVKIYRSFLEYCRQGRNPDLYVPPQEVSYFHTPPASMTRQPGPGMVSSEFVAAQQQQRQMMGANHAALSSQYQLPDQLHQILRGPSAPVRPPSTTLPSQPPVHRTPTAPGHLSRILPHENDPPRAQPVHPDTGRMALHQAHLRSPAPGPKTLPTGAQPLYRHVIGYALNLTRISPSMRAQTIRFAVPEGDYTRIPPTMPSKLPGEPGKRHLDEFSYLYRLRCSKIPGGGFSDENTWVTADNVWPDNMTVDLNGKHLQVRRKLHHGRYLPIDLTPHIQQGWNRISLCTNRRSDDTQPFEYALAVEIVGVKTHSRILSAVSTLSASGSIASIKRSLAGSIHDDDDIIMTSNLLTIGLFDPFTNAQICQTPVRGESCLHRDCFDLETFLSQCKRDKPGYPTVVDCWRCPICKSDVRPQSLIKDGFLMDVRTELARKGLLETRAIIVNDDGSWRPKAEEQATGVRSDSLEREEAAAAQRAKPKKAIETIELD